VISKVESEMHRTLLEVNFTDYKQASKEFEDLSRAIELCHARGDCPGNLKVLKSKMMWRMKRIDAEYTSIIESYKRWLKQKERKDSILKLKTCPKTKKAMTKFRMNYFEAMRFVKENPFDEDSEDEMLDITRREVDWDQDTPPMPDDYDLACYEKPGDGFGPEFEAPPIQAAAPPLGAPPSF